MRCIWRAEPFVTKLRIHAKFPNGGLAGEHMQCGAPVNQPMAGSGRMRRQVGHVVMVDLERQEIGARMQERGGIESTGRRFGTMPRAGR